MFAELVRQEFRFTARSLGQILLWSLVVGLASAAMVVTGVPLISHIGILLLNVILVGIPLATSVVLTVHYWRSMHGSYAAFTHAIPVGATTLFIAKVAYYVLVMLLSFIPALAAGVVLVGAQTIAAGQDLAQAYSELWSYLVAGASLLGSSPALIVFVISIIAAAIASVVQLLGAISFGFSGRFKVRGYSGPTIALVVTYFLNQILAIIGVLIVPIGLRIVDDVPRGIEYGMMLPDLVNAIRTGTEPTFVGLGGPLATIPLGILVGYLAVRSLKHHLYVR